MNPRLRLGLLGSGFAIAAWLAIFGDKTPVDAPVAARVSAPAGDQGRVAGVAAPEPEAAASDDVPGQVRRLHARRGWFEKADSGLDPFGVAPSRAAASEQQSAPPAPPPPEPPFVLIGRLEEQGRWIYFLERDGAAYVLGSGGEAAGFRLESDSDNILRFVRLSDRQEVTLAVQSDANR